MTLSIVALTVGFPSSLPGRSSDIFFPSTLRVLVLPLTLSEYVPLTTVWDRCRNTPPTTSAATMMMASTMMSGFLDFFCATGATGAMGTPGTPDCWYWPYCWESTGCCGYV